MQSQAINKPVPSKCKYAFKACESCNSERPCPPLIVIVTRHFTVTDAESR
jgi:hypothetical protein